MQRRDTRRQLLLLLLQLLLLLSTALSSVRPPTSPSDRTPVTQERALFQPGDSFADGRASVCYRIPALIAAGNTTLLAFAKAFNFSSDGCYPKPYWCGPSCGPRPTPARPAAPGDNTSTIVVRRSTDGGDSWGPIEAVARGVDFAAAYDELRDRVLVTFAGDSGLNPQPNLSPGDYQVVSSDKGRSWGAPASLKAVLGQYDGLLVGPGRGLQLLSYAKGKSGRLLWCGHADDVGDGRPGRLVPVWVSDDGGRSNRLTAVLPLNNTGTPECKGEPASCPGGHQWGPDEAQMVELSNGDIRFEARNNWAAQTGHHARMVAISRDGGETWGPISFDAALNSAPDCQNGLAKDPLTGAIYNSGPVLVHCSGPSCNGRVNLTVTRSTDDAKTWEPRTLLIHGGPDSNSSGGSGYSSLSDIPQKSQEMGVLFERDGPQCWYGSDCYMAFVRFPKDMKDASPPGPPAPAHNASVHSYTGAIGPVTNPERGFRMALYEFPKLDVLEGIAWDNSPLLHGQNITVTLTMIALNEYSRPFRPIDAAYLTKLTNGFAQLRKLHVKAIVNVYYNNVFGKNASYNKHCYMPNTFEEVYQHISQLAPVFHANADVIHALQTGFIGEAGCVRLRARRTPSQII